MTAGPGFGQRMKMQGQLGQGLSWVHVTRNALQSEQQSVKERGAAFGNHLATGARKQLFRPCRPVTALV